MRRLLLLSLFCLASLAVSPALAEPDYSTPEATLATYLEACKAGDFTAADACYTKSSREFLAKTPAFSEGRSPDMLRGTYERLSKVKFSTEKVNAKRAVLVSDDKAIPPFYVRVQEPKEGWRIDWHFMANYMRGDANGWSWKNPRADGLWKSRE